MNIKITDADKIKILNSDDIYEIMQKVLLRENKIDIDKEHFWILGLANNNKLLFIELISLGTINSTIVEPMEVFSVALQKRTVKVVLVHNHPSGELKPSQEDIDLTDRLYQVGRIVHTPVIDHLIITVKSYLSFADTGLLTEISKSTRWVPEYEIEQRIKREAAERAKLIADKKAQTAVKKRNKEMAITLKSKGFPDEIIAETTGLSLAEVQRL